MAADIPMRHLDHCVPRSARPITSPMAPSRYISRALAHNTELTRCAPICTILLLLSAALTISKPSAIVCDIGFSQ